MPAIASKQYSDDVSLLVLLLDTNPLFWSTTSITFSQFLSHVSVSNESIVLAFLNAVLGLNQLNQVVVIATGYSSCDYIYDSSLTSNHGNFESNGTGMPAIFGSLLKKLEEFVTKDEELSKEEVSEDRIPSCLLWPGTVCFFLHFFSTCKILSCLSGLIKRFCHSFRYVAVMNSIFSAQRLMRTQYSMAANSGLFCFAQKTIFATDLHSRGFVQLPKPIGVDFRASCFCHKKTIDMGYICSVCLSIFCEHHKKCSTCGSVFGQSKLDDASSASDKKRKAPNVENERDRGKRIIGVASNGFEETAKGKKNLGSNILEKKKTIHDLIKRASSIDDPLSPFDSFRRYRRNDLSLYLESGRGDRLSSSVKHHIQKLLKTNMEGFYGSDWPIQAKVKRKEMSSADAHYIFVRELRFGKAYETSTQRTCMEGCNQIAGFVHYRFILEEEIPVLYVYEIQLESRVQGKGLGEFLMQLIELIASKNRMSAIVLTVLTSNALAMTFYMSKLGISSLIFHYFTLSVKYEILCKTFDSEAKSVLEKTDESDEDLVPPMTWFTPEADTELQQCLATAKLTILKPESSQQTSRLQPAETKFGKL
ncbi:F15H18.15 [Arabidopsis thaliana]|nr:F15H18.15 [Arabidopsis thaliana]